jgi:NitT/TauT family transport system substrate-binding protein
LRAISNAVNVNRLEFCRETAAILAAGAAAVPLAARGQTLAPLTVGGSPIDSYKTVYFARQAGIFRKYGLDVTPTIINSGTAALSALAGGTIQVAFTSLFGVIEAHARGINFQIVAPAQAYSSEAPTAGLLVRKDSPIKTGADFNGKVIASLALKDLNALATLAWIDQNGGDSKTVKVIELPVAALLPALSEGRIEGMTTTPPFLDQAVASGNARILSKSYDALAKHFYASIFVATKEYVDKNRDTMSRFGRAMHESIVYTNAHLPETVDLVASYSGIPASVIANSNRATAGEYVSPRDVQPLIDVAVRYGLIPTGFSADDLISPTAVRAPR